MIGKTVHFRAAQELPEQFNQQFGDKRDPAKLPWHDFVDPSHIPQELSCNGSSINIELSRLNNSNSKLFAEHNRIAEIARPVPLQATRSAFAQRHPYIARLFSISAAVLAAPFIIVANIATGLTLAIIAACSDRFSKRIGESWYGQCLWGELADEMAMEDMSRGKRLFLGVLSCFAISSVLGIERIYEQAYESLDTFSLPPRPGSAARAQGSRLSPRMYRLGDAERDGRIPVFRNDEQIGYMRKDVLSSSDREVHALFDMNGNFYTGIAPHISGLTCCAYTNGLPLDIVPQPRDIEIQQGDAGNCYALIIMYGLLKHGGLNAKLSKNCDFNRDGSLTMVLSNTPNVVKSLERGGLAEYMKKQGYALSKDSANIEVTLSEKKLCQILAEQQGKDQLGRAYSNSLLVLAMEHFIGNLVRAKADTSELEPSFRVHSMSDRDRVPDAGELVANLFACSIEAIFWEGMPPTELSGALRKYKDTGCLLGIAQRPKPGFIYVSLDLDLNDGSAPERHAYALHDVELDEHGEVQGVVLINPHDTRLFEHLPMMELRRRGVRICKVDFMS